MDIVVTDDDRPGEGLDGLVIVAALGAGASPLTAVFCVIAGIAVALALSASRLLPYGSKNEGPTFAIPHGIVLFIGALCFILFLTEGALLDWSAVFLTSVRGMNASQAGLGYAAFALTMTIGRLTGDRVVRAALLLANLPGAPRRGRVAARLRRGIVGPAMGRAHLARGQLELARATGRCERNS